MLNDLFSIGISKIIIGTLALENESEFKKMLESYSDKIIVSLDSRNGSLAKRGWIEITEKSLVETAHSLKKLGVKNFIFTDVLKDGTLTRPNYKEIQKLADSIKMPLIIAGGISFLEDIQKLKSMNIE